MSAVLIFTIIFLTWLAFMVGWVLFYARDIQRLADNPVELLGHALRVLLFSIILVLGMVFLQTLTINWVLVGLISMFVAGYGVVHWLVQLRARRFK